MRNLVKKFFWFFLKIIKKIFLIYNNNISLKPIKINHNHSMDIYELYCNEERINCYKRI